MSADAISRLITNITLVVRSGMRHTRNGEPTWRRAESTEEKWLCVQLDRGSLPNFIPAGASVRLQVDVKNALRMR